MYKYENLIILLENQYYQPFSKSRVAQRKRAGPITQRSMGRNHPLLSRVMSPVPTLLFLGHVPANNIMRYDVMQSNS